MSTINYNNSYRTTGGLQRFDCLAWVNFNGTGTVAIRAAGNVSSITDNGTGDYTANFTSALPDADYARIVTANANEVGTSSVLSASSVRVNCANSSGALADVTNVSIACFR